MGTSRSDWTPPERFDEYRLVEELGRGSMGQVWLAHDSVLDRLVAVKFISELPASDAARERFLTEARAAARVQHPNIIAIYRVGEIGPRPYLISEYVRGETLDRIARPVRWPGLLDIALGLARGLAAAHRRGVLHRDLKPGNAILSETGEVKLLDFGLAKLVRLAAADDDSADADEPDPPPATDDRTAPPALPDLELRAPPDDVRVAETVKVLDTGSRPPAPAGDGLALPGLTSTGALMGTPAYMPPEAWRGEPATRRSDVYSLGALLYDLAAGVPPHRGESQAAVRSSALDADPPPLATAVPGVDPRFAAIVDGCLRRQPDQRFASGEAVREALEVLAAGDPAAAAVAVAAVAPAHPLLEHPRPRPRGWRAAGGVVAALPALAALAVLGVVVRRGRDHAAPRRTTAAVAMPGRPGCPADMVAVPAGTFQMGSPPGSGDADERPRHQVTLSAYCLDRTEVTVAAYAACAAAGACVPPPLTVNWPSYSAQDVERFSRWCNHGDRPDHPINCIDWYAAAAYCAWRGRRLPTEAEWEYAARGGDDRVYPWGNAAPSATRLNACGAECAAMASRDAIPWRALHDGDDGWLTTAPVGSYPDGASRSGALDLAGNVWEWTADWYAPYTADPEVDPQGEATGTSRVSRGGGWSNSAAGSTRAADRDWSDPAVREASLGFRCAYAN
jgi:formylglycine-generating enzyme required for sulfatase activity